MTKYPDKGQLRVEGFVWAHSSRAEFIRVEKSWQQDSSVISHPQPRAERTNACTLTTLLISTLQTPRPKHKMVQPTAGWVFPHQLMNLRQSHIDMPTGQPNLYNPSLRLPGGSRLSQLIITTNHCNYLVWTRQRYHIVIMTVFFYSQ